MKYMGSKARIAKHILPIILKDRKEGQWYVEPFVGGANMIDKVDGNRIGSDSNEHVIRALEFIQNGDLPMHNREYTESDYKLAAAKARDGEVLNPVDSYALIAFSLALNGLGAGREAGIARGIKETTFTSSTRPTQSKSQNFLV